MLFKFVAELIFIIYNKDSFLIILVLNYWFVAAVLSLQLDTTAEALPFPSVL